MNIGNWIYINGEYVQAVDFVPDSQENCVYEVLRCINGVPLFFEEHFNRLEASLIALDIGLPDKLKGLRTILHGLIQKNNIREGNVKVNICTSGVIGELCAFQIAHRYPSPNLYTTGVGLLSYNIERSKPNIKHKSVNNNLRAKVSEMLAKKGIYEILLIDSKSRITEGSRSNILFIQNKTVYSPPSEVMLKGITRGVVIELLPKIGLSYVEKHIPFNALNNFEACLLTGTSPKVIPVCQIDDHTYRADNPQLISIRNAYNKAIEDYCAHYTKNYT